MIKFPSPVASMGERGVIPFVTQRKGEEAAPANLVILRHRVGMSRRLYYRDEDVRDRPVRGVLWARCSFSMDGHGMPTGEPQWRFMHPYRQMATMLAGRCQVCTRPAKTPRGYIFMAGPKDEDPEQPSILTHQPPVCARHVRAVAKLCPHMEENPTLFLARSAPLYGVLGSVYGRGPRGYADVVSTPSEPVKFGDPLTRLLLGSQLVRRLSDFRVLEMDQLLAELEAAA
ncbi:hypothetical protein [Streptomyces sp. AC627_RSS907]|uniref:hypothetical protein n=1 Tax=Streptomyces sp. AC627_RSS907 TaxID=2823684 RepID=UPI0027E47105|nr:hypothetical protein [Streptomyces sp. AC627_RSS907]